MARCKLTNMNLRNIRKSREYQCLLIDFVKVGVIGKTAAEGLLGYTIPAGLIASTTTSEPSTDEDEDEDEVVTILHFDSSANNGAGEWLSVEYTLTGDAEADTAAALALANETFNTTIDTISACEINPDYIEGESSLAQYYREVNPAPETWTDGMLLWV